MKRTILIAFAALLLSTASAAAQTIFVVRHAERADATSGGTMMGNDPELSPAGRERAAALASMLRDAGITAIYVSEYARTRQTAGPLAKALGLKPTIVAAKDIAALVDKLRTARGNLLVVGHSNSIPDVLEALGVNGPPKIEESDYDNLFVVSLAPKPTLLRLHYPK